MVRAFQSLAYALCFLFTCQANFAMEEKGLSIPFDIPKSIQKLNEEEAHLLAKMDYCLCEDDKMGTWKETLVWYGAFWQYYRHENAIEALAKIGCPLAEVYNSYGKDNFYNSPDHLIPFIQTGIQNVDFSFLEALSPIALLKLCRDSYVFRVIGYMTLAPLPDMIKDKRENFYSNPAMVDGGRRADLLDSPLDSRLTNLTENIMLGGENLLKACHQELLKRGNTSFLLFLLHSTAFSAGLDGLDLILLYETAQNTYEANYGHIHPGTFGHLFEIPQLEKLKTPSGQLWKKNRGIDLGLCTLNGEQIKTVEGICEALIAKGDTVWALNLGYSWKCNMDHAEGYETLLYEECLTKATGWFLEALKYPVSEQCAENELKDIERECLYLIHQGVPHIWAYNLGVFYALTPIDWTAIGSI